MVLNQGVSRQVRMTGNVYIYSNPLTIFEIFITTIYQIKLISFYLTGFSNNVKQGKHQNTFYTINVKRLNATRCLLFCNVLSFFYSKVTFHQDLSFVQIEAATTKIKYFRCRKYITCSC